MTRYAFSFDSSACSGCKACQVACKDKHNLPVGTLWRQVYEVTGGGWTRRGNAWVSDVFAYHVSLACNHCERPICVEVCPAKAITQRIDGVVLINSDRCLGCRYCSWACPYHALQYDAVAGRMSKCDLCADDLDRGKPPACVAGCPLRALELLPNYAADDDAAVFPLPQANWTDPALVIKPHSQSARADQGSAKLEHLGATPSGQPRDFSLVAFTILAQMAAGGVWVLCALLFFSTSINLSGRIGVAIVASMVLALLASLFHLGTPVNAWRALANWRSSWLSREILFGVVSAAACGVVAVLALVRPDAGTAAVPLAALAGMALVYSMANAYRLRTVPAWNTPLTLVSFTLTALVLGMSGIAAITAITAGDGPANLKVGFVLVVLSFVIAEWAVLWLWYGTNPTSLPSTPRPRGIAYSNSPIRRMRWLLSLSGVIVFGVALFGVDARVAFPVGFVLLLSSELVGRYLFYQMRLRKELF